MESTDSILVSVKKMLGPSAQYEYFDPDIVIHINSVFMILYQLGVGPQDKPFSITSDEETWDQFFADEATLELVKTYVYLKVKLVFDPPLGGALVSVMEKQIAEFEWRLNVAADPGNKEGT